MPHTPCLIEQRYVEQNQHIASRKGNIEISVQTRITWKTFFERLIWKTTRCYKTIICKTEFGKFIQTNFCKTSKTIFTKQSSLDKLLKVSMEKQSHKTSKPFWKHTKPSIDNRDETRQEDGLITHTIFPTSLPRRTLSLPRT